MSRVPHISIAGAAFAVALAVAPMVAQAQITELPEYAYTAVAEISMVTTAQTECEGAKVNDRRLQRAMTDFVGQLAGDGYDPVAAVQFMETEVALAQLASQEAALRARHGVAPEGMEGLCAAIKAELEINKDLAKIVKFP